MFNQTIKMMWRRRRKNIFLLLELFFSFLILNAVCLFLLTQWKMYKQPLGYNPKQVGELSFNVEELLSAQARNEEGDLDSLGVSELLQSIKREIKELDGISEVSIGSYQMPFNNSHWTSSHETDNQDELSFVNSQIVLCDEDFNKVYEMDQKMGVWLKDKSDSQFMDAVVNQLFYDKYMKGAHDLGATSDFLHGVRVVGVTDKYKFAEFEKEEPVMFTPVYHSPSSASNFEIKYDEGINPYWQKEINDICSRYFKEGSFIMQKIDERRKTQSRPTWIIIIGMAIVSLFLIINVSIGLFGALQYAVEQRRGEIGLRKAMGATPGNILWQFLLEMIVLSTFGVGLALLFAFQVPLLNLMNIQSDTGYESISLTLGFVYLLIVLCSLIPAWRATRVMPAVALHDE